jgi:hypothetical protein
MVGVDSIWNYFLPTNKIIQIIFLKILTTFTIYGYTHSNSFVDSIHTFFYITIIVSYF